jgi:putative mRNA 3-end processing factor
MQIQFEPSGIFLPEIGLWLDNTEDCESNWISHGHSDHASGVHGRVFGTAETLEFYRMRLPEETTAAPEFHPVEFGTSWELRGARLTAFPASHIVGSAQLLIELNGERVLYTGDIKRHPPICGRATEIVACDRLIIEATFGLPIYRFLPREAARERIVAFANETLASGAIPVFIGYALGRGQEIAHVLCEAGVPTMVHGWIARYIPGYERAGYGFPGWRPYDNSGFAGNALVTIPGFQSIREARGKNYRLAYVSGWAAMDNARARVGAQELIPYSDHAGFDELITLIEETEAREVDVVHGYTEIFARILEERGIAARAPRETSARAASGEVPEG